MFAVCFICLNLFDSRSHLLLSSCSSLSSLCHQVCVSQYQKHPDYHPHNHNHPHQPDHNDQVCLCVERLVEGGGEVGGVLSTLTSLALEVFVMMMMMTNVMTMTAASMIMMTIAKRRATLFAAFSFAPELFDDCSRSVLHRHHLCRCLVIIGVGIIIIVIDVIIFKKIIVINSREPELNLRTPPQVRVAGLRALGSICCVLEGIRFGCLDVEM